jgi:ADP-ribosyl-[dinitrogen reductase] hydrolase
MLIRQDRITGGLMGLLIGDALGVPYEFNSPEDLPPVSQNQLIVASQNLAPYSH